MNPPTWLGGLKGEKNKKAVGSKVLIKQNTLRPQWNAGWREEKLGFFRI